MNGHVDIRVLAQVLPLDLYVPGFGDMRSQFSARELVCQLTPNTEAPVREVLESKFAVSINFSGIRSCERQ